MEVRKTSIYKEEIMKNQISEVMTMLEFKQLVYQQYYKPVYFLSKNKQHKIFINEVLKRIEK